MSYIDKTVSKDEALIKQAKISKLSFLDRFIAAALYLLAGIFGLVSIFVPFDPIEVGNVKVAMSGLGMAGAGGALFALALIILIYKLIQKLTGVTPEQAVSKGPIIRLVCYGVFAMIVGILVAAFAGENVALCNIIITAAGLFCGLFVLVFAIIRYKCIKLVVTDKRVFGRKNIWRTESFDLPIAKADNVVIVFSFWGKMFNYASVQIKSVMGDYVIRYVKSPEEFKNLVIDFAAKEKEAEEAAE